MTQLAPDQGRDESGNHELGSVADELKRQSHRLRNSPKN